MNIQTTSSSQPKPAQSTSADKAVLPLETAPVASAAGSTSAKASAQTAAKPAPEYAPFAEKGIVLTDESKQAVQTFLKTAPGTEAEKMTTIKTLADKGITPSDNTLKAVHAALTGEPFGKQAAALIQSTSAPVPENSQAAVEKALGLGRLPEAVANMIKVEVARALLPTVPSAQQAAAQAALAAVRLPSQSASASTNAVSESLQTLQANIAAALKPFGISPDQIAALIKQSPASEAAVLVQAAVQKTSEALAMLLAKNSDDALLLQLKTALDGGKPVADIIQAIRTLFAGDRTATIKPLAEAVQLAARAEAVIQSALPASGIVLPVTAETEPLPVQKAVQLIQKEPSLQTVLSFIKEAVPELTEAAAKAEQIAAAGKELAARAELMKAAEPLLPPPADRQTPIIPDELFAHVPPASKTVVRTAITETMAQSAIDFRQFKRDIVRQLQTAELMAKTPAQAKPAVEHAIKTLDNAILKGNFMLYTDMKTEKQLMQASSQLAEAKKLLAKGSSAEAARIVADVKATVDKIVYKPSDTRVMHMATAEASDTAPKQLAAAMAKAFEVPSPRSIADLVRAAGFNSEHEQATALLQGKDAPVNQKQALLASMNTGTGTNGEQAASTLTGHQLLSKPEPGLQSMMLSLPFLLGGQADSVNVMIRSKNGGEQVDWENCSLHFLFETKKLGPVGLTISASDRNVSLKVQNDQPAFADKMQPLTSVMKDRLSDIGYRVSSIQFTSFPQTDRQAAGARTAQPTLTEKGFDFTI